MNIEATADLIMSARHSDAFDREACVKILRDNLGDKERQSVRETVKDEANRRPSVTQLKPESWPKIAREAWNELANCPSSIGSEGETAIILAAIERSHAAQPQSRDEASRILRNAQGNIIDKLLSFVTLVEPWVSDAACNDKFGYDKSREIYSACVAIRPIIDAAKQGERDAIQDLAAQPQPSKASPFGERSEELTPPEYAKRVIGTPQRSDHPPSLAKATDDKQEQND